MRWSRLYSVGVGLHEYANTSDCPLPQQCQWPWLKYNSVAHAFYIAISGVRYSHSKFVSHCIKLMNGVIDCYNHDRHCPHVSNYHTRNAPTAITVAPRMMKWSVTRTRDRYIPPGGRSRENGHVVTLYLLAMTSDNELNLLLLTYLSKCVAHFGLFWLADEVAGGGGL